MHPMTPKQLEVLRYIKAYQHEEGMPPTRAEMCEAFGWKSPNAAECHLRALASHGLIKLVPAISRGIKVL